MNSPLVPTRFLEATLFGLCLLLIVIAYCARLYVPFTFGYADPGWQMAGVQSVAEDGDLDLRNQLNFDIKRTSGQVAAGRGGQWYPSHEIPIIFFATPFYRIWGFNGCLIANVVAALLMGLGSFLIARSFASFPASAGASLLAFLTTPCLTLAYSFSNDLFAASIFTWLLFALIRQRYWLVGILLGACLLSRLATVALIPAIGLYCLLVGSPRAAVRVMVPLALGGLCYSRCSASDGAPSFGGALLRINQLPDVWLAVSAGV